MVQSYSGRNNEYGTPSRTIRGELIKSRGEKQIADYFYSNGIKYFYEDQTKTTKSAFRRQISKPDFYLPKHDVYVEYWGMIDVGDAEQRTRYRQDMDWKKRQYYDNGIRFLSIFPWHLNDLDGAFRSQYKMVMKRDFVTDPVGVKTVYALPISSNLKQLVQTKIPTGLKGPILELQYIPHYFVEYDCFTQGTVAYQRVNLSSHGTIVISGQNGSIVDIGVQSGVPPAIARTGYFLDCGVMLQKETPRSEVAPGVTFNKIDAGPVTITKYDAERTATVEVAKSLSQTYTHNYRNGRIDTKTIRPYANEVKIVGAKLLNIPMMTAIYEYKDKKYQRIIQAATNKIFADSLIYCIVGRNPHFAGSIIVCEDCGDLACTNHGKMCVVCGKGICLAHAVARGLVMKKYYCSTHVPQKPGG